jgi:hypothetical protein
MGFIGLMERKAVVTDLPSETTNCGRSMLKSIKKKKKNKNKQAASCNKGQLTQLWETNAKRRLSGNNQLDAA